MEAIQEILGDKPHLLNLWLDFEEWRTLEWRLAKEIDKFQAIFMARGYEDKYRILWLIEEFYSNAVIKKQQITTNFLVQAAVEIYNNKTR
jgi:5'-deoxynucleotidase YfbR-like HD superfamily hydrolase